MCVIRLNEARKATSGSVCEELWPAQGWKLFVDSKFEQVIGRQWDDGRWETDGGSDHGVPLSLLPGCLCFLVFMT